jgi:hypothetical protein
MQDSIILRDFQEIATTLSIIKLTFIITTTTIIIIIIIITVIIIVTCENEFYG